MNDQNKTNKQNNKIRRFLSLLTMDTKELIRSKWTLFYFLTFSIISVGIIFSGEASEIYGFSGISKFIASLVNISFLLIPIFSLGPSSISISGMRENLSLEYMLSFPVTKKEIYLSKFLSIFLVSISTLFFVLFIALSFFRFREVDTKIITAFLFILLLSFVFISIGFLISVLSKTKSSAIALSLFVWFIIIIGGELGTLGFISVSKIPEISFFPIIFLNPAETFRVAVIAIFSSSLDILGPFGIYIYSKLGKSLIPISALLMSIYGFLTLVIGYKLFSMQKVSTDIIRRR